MSPARLTPAAWLSLLAALILWFLFDRLWPRLAPGRFVAFEAALLAVALLAAAGGFAGEARAARRAGRARRAAPGLALFVALTAAAFFAAVGLLDARWLPTT